MVTIQSDMAWKFIVVLRGSSSEASAAGGGGGCGDGALSNAASDGALLSSSDRSWSECSAISLNTSSKVKCIVVWGPAVAGSSQGVGSADAYETHV